MPRLPDFNNDDYKQGCPTCKFSELVKVGYKVIENSYFINVFRCICPIPLWMEVEPYPNTSIHVVFEAKNDNGVFIHTKNVKYIMTSSGNVMPDGTCRSRQPHILNEGKSSFIKRITNFFKRFDKGDM